jgi:hypothetical protein
MMRTKIRVALLLAPLALAAFSAVPANQGYVCGLPEIRMNFQNGPFCGSFYDVGFPSQQRTDPATGIPVVPDIENGGDIGVGTNFMGVPLGSFLMPTLYGSAHQMVNQQQPFEKGFGLTSPILFAVEGHGCGLVAIDGSAEIDKDSLPTPVRDGHQEPINISALNITVTPQTAARAFDRSSVFLISVDPASPDFLDLYPVTVEFGVSNFCCDASLDIATALANGGFNWPCDPFCASWHHLNKLAIVPLPGTPLRPNTMYAAVVTNRVTWGNNPLQHLQRSRGLVDIINCMNNVDFNGNPRACSGSNPVKTEEDAAGISFPAYNAYQDALNVLHFSDNTGGMGNAKNTYEGPAIFDTISALTVFRTGDPTAGFRGMVADALTNPAADWTLKGPILPAGGKFNPADTRDFSLPADQFGAHPKIKAPGVFSEFCVYETSVSMPVYQEYFPSLLFKTSQKIHFSNLGVPALDHNDDGTNGFPLGRMFITIPREGQIPPDGYPVVVMVREGGGGDVPLVSRGVDDHFPEYGGTDPTSDDVEFPQPGEGPALYLARAGYAGVQIDDPYGGVRRPPGAKIKDEDNLIFGNKGSNEWAIRDNIRQMALELAVLGGKTLNVNPFGAPGDLANCTQIKCTYSSLNGNTNPTAGRQCCDVDFAGNLTGACNPGNPNPPAPVLPLNTPIPLAFRFDTSQLAIMGHSVGASVVPLALSAANAGIPIYKRAILSGSGGSFITNALHKQEPPFAVPLTTGRHGLREMAESWVELDRGLMSEGDPALGVVQMALEPGDTPAYDWRLNPLVMNSDPHTPSAGYILNFQGMVDHYIQPPTSNAQTLAMGLGLGITHEMTVGNGGAWFDSYDSDPGFYPQNPGFECEDRDDGTLLHSNCFSNDNHDFRAFMPYSWVSTFSGWKNSMNPGGATSWGRTNLPARGKSLIVQLNNDGYNAHFTDEDTGHFQTNKQDGHEAMWQHLGPKLQYQCFLRSARRATPLTPLGSAIINDDVFRTGGDNARTGVSECCAHRFDVTGAPLLDNCSACASYVCSQPGKSYCCLTTVPGWDQACVDVAKPPLPPPNCNAWTELPYQIPCAGCIGNTPTCSNPACICTGGWWQPPPLPAPTVCDPGNPDR